MMFRLHGPVAACLSAVLLAAGCGDPAGPSFDVDFPFFYLQDIDVAGAPGNACFLGQSGDAVACAGTRLYFIDYGQGYVRADVDLGYPIECCATTAEGGYGLAVSGQLLFYVSDETYLVHEPVLLPGEARIIVTKPTSNIVWVVCDGGWIATVSTVTWQVTAWTATDVSDPVQAVVSADGASMFVADAADSTVRKLGSSTFQTQAVQEIPGGATDLCSSPYSGVYASSASLPEIWHLDQGTGLHDYTVPIPAWAAAIAVTPDDAYLYAGCPGEGTAVVDMEGFLEASSSGFGDAGDISVSGDGQRAVICSPSLMKVFILQR
jgi:hypothetical protein